ncbi:S-adenosyl-L-methionine-dependent methyltransferase [Zopfia rhizophila CBS 207.26]|uniref:S-adenosyl-L-methionine-dependent methyltransferase n=1 Tax=Zopfia rhizophila CBS 207.26 TaxID=1314779 RepID=A0A6A6EB14_9PEZI|nr:S-adenosyl-L-methionine-dependent methyltransferase [Zopfia rhizophila CBS 207.26]
MDIPELTKNLAALAEAGPGVIKEEERQGLIAACNNLRYALEYPREYTIRTMLGGHDAVVLRLGVDMGLIDIAVSAKEPVTVNDLAIQSSSDAALVRRIMRLLARINIFEEVEMDTYATKPLAAVYFSGSPLREAVIHLSTTGTAVAKLPEYFAEKGYKNPDDAFDSPWQYGEQTDLHYFDWLAERPRFQKAFNTVMGIQRQGRGPPWFEFFPVEEKLKVQSPDQTLLVDIGGGIGHDIIGLKQRFPNLLGRLVVEDLPGVIAAVNELPEGIEAVGHDFFQPQPELARNAKSYYLRTILHDWPDKQAGLILKNIRDVMAKDSILLINESVMPESNVPLFEAQLDFNMMARFSSLERTEKQWRELLEEAGFEWVKLWRSPVPVPGSGCLIEAVLKE